MHNYAAWLKNVIEFGVGGSCRLRGHRFLAFPSDSAGLGNRLKCMANLYVWYGSAPTWLVWKKTGWVSKSFRELFDFADRNSLREVNWQWSKWIFREFFYPYFPQRARIDYWRFYLPPEFEDENYRNVADGQPFVIDFLFNQMPMPYLSAYLDFFGKLRPSATVRARMEELAQESDYVAVFVRNNLHKTPKNVSSIERYLEIMRSFPPDQKFFMSAMHPKFAKEIYDEFGDRVFELPGKNYHSMTDAVADMFLLGQGKTLITSTGTTFSEVAWMLGGGKAQVLPLETDLLL